MKIFVEGRGPIALKAIKLLEVRAHEIVDKPETAEAIIWCRGNDWNRCVTLLQEDMERYFQVPFVVVTSEHGEIPTADPDYAEYHATKAAQKMLCKCFIERGGSCIDVSPAFVEDSNPQKKMNLDPVYRAKLENACNPSFPVTCLDVAKAIQFAVENCDTMSGSVIRVSAGWTQGRI